jgi:two-component system NtrC family response regulator
MVAEGEFRRDLYFRLRGMHIALPPLREIAEDINEMTCKFIQRHCEKFHMSTKGFSPDFLDALMHYEWPGNVRELMHTLEQALSRAGDDAVLFPRHLPKAIRARLARRELESDRSRPAPTHHSEAGPAETFPDLRTYRDQQLALSEQRYLRNLMEITGGDIAASCSISGLSRARLYALLKQHSIPRK